MMSWFLNVRELGIQVKRPLPAVEPIIDPTSIWWHVEYKKASWVFPSNIADVKSSVRVQ